MNKNYYVSNNGSDFNSGTQASPLKTLGEVARRINNKPITETINIYLEDDIEENVFFDVKTYPNINFGEVILNGTRKLLYTGTLTNVQPYDINLFQEQIISDSNTSWANLIGNLIVLSDGSASYLYKDLGNGNVITGPFYNADTQQVVTPQIGDQYTVYQQTKITGNISGQSIGYFCLIDLILDCGGKADFDNLNWYGGYLYMNFCRIIGFDDLNSWTHLFLDHGTDAEIYGCWIESHIRLYKSSLASFGGCLFTGHGTAPTADGQGSILAIDYPCVGYGEQTFLQSRKEGMVIVNDWYFVKDQTYAMGINGIFYLNGKIWGENINIGCLAQVGSKIYYSAGNLPDFNNNVTYINLGGINVTKDQIINNGGTMINDINQTIITPFI